MSGAASIVVLKMGETLPAIAARRGDFEDWIARGLGLALGALRVVRAYAGEPLPSASEESAVVVTGSSAMVSAREAWSEQSGAWLAEVVARGRPVLGICYGHQLLAHALGGRVGPNPAGRQIGTVAVALDGHAGDPLLGELPASLPAQATHVETVLEAPAGARVLGRTRLDPCHVIAFSARAWGVQFHPEFDADVMRGYVEGRREQIRAEGQAVDALLAGVREAPEAAGLLRRFAELAARDH